MNRQSIMLTPVGLLYCLAIILLCQSTRPVQSIALSSLCGSFGHSCYGGNWGKRTIATSSSSESDIIQANANINNDASAISTEYQKDSMNKLLLEEIQSNLIRQRLRQLLGLE